MREFNQRNFCTKSPHTFSCYLSIISVIKLKKLMMEFNQRIFVLVCLVYFMLFIGWLDRK